MSDKAWKQAERRIASFFGTVRAVLSGSSNRDDKGCSDSIHPRLFIEAKYREKHQVRSLHDKTKALAAKEKKIPVVALVDKSRPGFLICVHCDDFVGVVAEWIAGLDEVHKDGLEGDIRRAYLRRRGLEVES
jgi:hypothetical protein